MNRNRNLVDSDDDLVKWEAQLRKGGLGLAVLACLWGARLYGLEILRKLATVGGLSVPEGTIYPLLNRMKTAGYVESEWVEAATGHPRKYFRLTESGQHYVRGIASTWFDFAAGLNRLLEPLEENTHAKRKDD